MTRPFMLRCDGCFVITTLGMFLRSRNRLSRRARVNLLNAWLGKEIMG